MMLAVESRQSFFNMEDFIFNFFLRPTKKKTKNFLNQKARKRFEATTENYDIHPNSAERMVSFWELTLAPTGMGISP
jgi:hypothetical protein